MLHFSEHALQRMAERGISKRIVLAVLRNGRWAPERDGSKRFSIGCDKAEVVVVLNNLTVVTAYARVKS